MQNRYTGDIGDFGKLGLLRVLSESGLTIGVNWYLTPNESHNGDGRHVDYLKKTGFRACDEQLWQELKHIVESEQREVTALERDCILPAIFYSEKLDFQGARKSERIDLREKWHRAAIRRLAGVDVVFVDPDNGLLVPSAEGTGKENKFVTVKELADYYKQGSSVIYYQHKARRPDSFYTDQHTHLLERPEFTGASGFGLKFRTTSQRYYFCILQAQHEEIVRRCADNIISSAWKEHFSVL
ncbi:MAG: hypothetical protein IJU68_07760 [Bacteroidales bacterium]|nr:hypothetical protein [Bacteroidales bacterium]